MTGTALEQGCDWRQGSRGARTDAGQGSEARQSQFIDEIIDIPVSVQRQNPASQNAFSKPQRFHSQRIQKIVEIHPEDHGGSPGRRIQKDVKVSQFQHTVKMVDDTAESSDDSADAAGTVH